MKNKRMQIIWRYALVSVCVTFVALGIVANMVKTTVIYADEWNNKADSLLNKVKLIQPKRGDIMASDGSVLATNITTYTIAIDYRAAAGKEKDFRLALDSIADSLAVYYPSRKKAQWREYLTTPLAKPRKERTQSHILLRDVEYADYLRILGFPFFKRFKNAYTHGLYYTSRVTRVRPYGQMASRSIGRCKYEIEPSVQNPKSSLDYTEVLRGKSGLEGALDSILFGKSGTSRYVQLTHGVKSWVDEPPVDGRSVKTTIDINMQDIVENELHAMLNRTHADWGTCILMEVATGDIKAISNLERDKKSGKYIEGRNYALSKFEPGSVMKPISMIVALEDGYAYPLDKAYQIGSTYNYAGGAPIHDTHSPTSLPVRRFIEYSSNIGMTKLIAPHYEHDLNAFQARLAQIGFFDPFNTGMAGEVPPEFPHLDPKAGGRVGLSRMTYGYNTLIPPLYVCAVYNAIANDGRFVRPRLYKELIDRKGNVEHIDVSYVRDSICSPANAKVLREMIHEVVHGSGGTAKTLRNDIVNVVGKTGTSRIAHETSREARKAGAKVITGYKEGQYRLAFCGFFPYENPKYTCMVLISNPANDHGAATTSGTVVKNIAIKMFARGMLDNSEKFVADPKSDNKLVMMASSRAVSPATKKYFNFSETSYLPNPDKPAPGTVPNVEGLGLREAVARIEDMGYKVQTRGTGHAVRQSPTAGTALKRGSTVKVEFSSK